MKISLNTQIFFGALLGVAFGIILGHCPYPRKPARHFFSVLIF